MGITSSGSRIRAGNSNNVQWSSWLGRMCWRVHPGCQTNEEEAYYISTKKYFCPEWIAQLEWTRSIRAVIDTPGADYSAPGLNTTQRVTSRPPIAVSPYLLALSVSFFKWTLWRCGQLWSYVQMESLGTRLHRDCNAMGDFVKISPRVSSICAHNAILSLPIIHIITSRQMYVAVENPSLIPSVFCLTTRSYL